MYVNKKLALIWRQTKYFKFGVDLNWRWKKKDNFDVDLISPKFLHAKICTNKVY